MNKKNYITVFFALLLSLFLIADVTAQTSKKKKKRRRLKFKKSRGYVRFSAPYVDTTIFLSKQSVDTTTLTIRDTLMNICKSFIGLRYRYGGSDPRGFDCSGYVMYCFKRIGMSLPHHSGAQMALGKIVSENDAEPGDIIYFGHSGRRRRSTYISHSGIVYSNENGKIYFIHSASSVGIRIDCLDQHWYRARFKGIRRVLPD